MKNTKVAWLLASLSILLIFLLSACIETTDPQPVSIQGIIDEHVKQGQRNLFAVAITKTSIYADLSGRNYPFTLLYVTDMDSYLTNHQMTKNEFLNHPKLTEFLKAHLIPGIAIKFGKIQTDINNSVYYVNALGDKIEFRSAGIDNGPPFGILINNVFNDGCTIADAAEPGVTPNGDEGGVFCGLIDSPIDFKWE